MKGTPDLKIYEAFIATLLLKSLMMKYLEIVWTTLSSFESIKPSKIYTILEMESTSSKPSTNTTNTALSASDQLTKGRSNNQKSTGKQVTCSLGQFGHNDKKFKV